MSLIKTWVQVETGDADVRLRTFRYAKCLELVTDIKLYLFVQDL